MLSRHIRRPGVENLIYRVTQRLHRHALIDALLFWAPPAFVGIILIALLHRTRWMELLPAILVVAGILLIAGLGIFLRLRPARPSVRTAASLADQKSGARDHFLTLATIDPAREPAILIARLRQQAEAFGSRLEPKRDFPYHFKRSAFWSSAISLLAGLLVYFFLPAWSGALFQPGAQQPVAELIERMAEQPTLRELAHGLERLAVKLDEPKIPVAEKQAALDQMKERIEEQRAKEQQGEARDLLGQAAAALEGLQKEQQTSNGESQHQQEKGGGGLESNAAQRGKGESNQNQGSGTGRNDSTTQPSQQKMDQGNSGQANSKEQGPSKSQAGDTASGEKQPDPNRPSPEPTREKAEKAGGNSRDGAGKQQASEEPPPQGGTQADRFYKPGEGKEGLAGKKGYVTVQLPEEVVADSKGQSAVSKDAGAGRGRAKVPVSNVPLPPHVPNAPAEKQHVPLEYRGILR